MKAFVSVFVLLLSIASYRTICFCFVVGRFLAQDVIQLPPRSALVVLTRTGIYFSVVVPGEHARGR